MTALVAVGRSGSRGPRPSAGPARLLAAGGLAAFAVGLLVTQGAVRRAEAWATSGLAEWLLRMDVIRVPERPIVLLDLPAEGSEAPRWIGMLITPECTVALLLAPLLLLAAAMTLGRRLPIRSVVAATSVTVGTLVAVNLLRLVLIVGATHRWGMSAFRWSHEVYGALVSIGGICLAIVLFLKILTRLSPGGTGTPSYG